MILAADICVASQPSFNRCNVAAPRPGLILQQRKCQSLVACPAMSSVAVQVSGSDHSGGATGACKGPGEGCTDALKALCGALCDSCWEHQHLRRNLRGEGDWKYHCKQKRYSCHESHLRWILMPF